MGKAVMVVVLQHRSGDLDGLSARVRRAGDLSARLRTTEKVFQAYTAVDVVGLIANVMEL